MAAKEFGARLRELRKERGLTQRELASQVGVDFSYLSKIEGGVVSPPSEKVISRIATALKTGENELLTLAGRIPPDIAQTLKSSKMAQRLVRASNKISEGTEMIANSLKNFKDTKFMTRLAVSLVLVMLVSVSLWFASPVSALTVNITNPSTGTLGSSYSFSVAINIENQELLPITDITVYIYRSGTRSSYQATLGAMPLANGTKSYTDSQTGNAGAAAVTATTTSGWSSGYGYGYRSVTFEGSPNAWGYGYGYGGLNSITYNIAWTSPSGWPTGTYLIETKITAVSTQLTKTGSSITMSAASTGGGLPTSSGTVSTNLFGTQGSVNINRTTGVILSTVTATSSDGNVVLTIPSGTKALTETGLPVSNLTAITVTPPAPPEDKNIIGLAHDFGPDGATFDPPITLKFTYDASALPAGATEADLVIAYYDTATGKWVTLAGTVDTVANTITAQVSHFTVFTILATPKQPAAAAFTLSDLTISPATVDVKETVTISTTVKNTGDIAGSYYVTLTVNGVPVATKSINLAGGASQQVNFTTSGNTAGTYSVDVNGKTGQFTVKATPTPTTPTPTTPTPTTPTPTTPTPTTPTPPVTPVVPGTNWWLIGGIVIGVAVVIGLLFRYLLRQK